MNTAAAAAAPTAVRVAVPAPAPRKPAQAEVFGEAYDSDEREFGFALPRRPLAAGGWALQRKCACGGSGGLSGRCDDCARKSLLGVQRRASIAETEDRYEREADRAADEAIATTSRGAGVIAAMPRQIQRMSTKAAGPTEALPASVRSVLAGAGHPLEPSLRGQMEQRFAHDFSRVRVHADDAAARSADDVGALAYTLGPHVVFGRGQWAPQTRTGRWLLGHELAHVVQQGQADGPVPEARAKADADPLDAQADGAADTAMRGERVSGLARGPRQLQRFAACRPLLDAQSRGSVAESSVRDELLSQRSAVAPIEREFPIPEASAAPQRTEPSRRRGGDVIDPQVIEPNIYARADLAQLNGSILELIEVKVADWTEMPGAESQLLRYVEKGNGNPAEMTRLWRQRGRPQSITGVRPMPMDRFRPLSPRRLAGTPVSMSWCTDGLIVFKAMADQDPEVFLCTVSDQGRIDAFLDRVLGRAEDRIDGFIRDEVEGPAAQRLAQRTLREIAREVVNLPMVRRFLPPLLGEEALIDLIVQQLQPFEAVIRSKAAELVQRAVAELRRMLQAEIRSLLQSSFNVLCAAATAMTAQELLDEFDRQMRRRALQLMPVAVATAASAMMVALLKLLGEALLEALQIVVAAVVIVIAAVVLWEVAAAIAASSALTAAAAAIGEFLVLVFSRVRFA